MKKLRLFVHSLTFFTIIIVVAGVIYVGGTVRSSNKSASSSKSDKSVIEIRNHTQSFQVVSAEKHNDHIKLKLRNNSQKDITAFVISSVISPDDTFTYKMEFAYSEIDSVIAPGQIYESAISISTESNNQKSIPLDLVAVVFNDKSSEGNQKVVQEIEYERLGQKVQFMRAIPVLSKMLAQPDGEMPMYLDMDLKDDLETALSASDGDVLVQLKKERPQLMSKRRIDEIPGPVKTGLHNARQYFLRKVQELEDIQKTQNGNLLRGAIIRIKQNCERIVSRL